MNFRAFRTQVAIVLALATAACGGGGGGSNPPSPPPPQSQTITFGQQGPLVLMVGATVTNTASGGGGSGAISYQSSDTNVLTVNATSGVATGVAIGTATITATKAADANFTLAQATYTIHVQTTQPMTAWIGETNSQVFLPDLALGKEFVSVQANNCQTPENIFGCMFAAPGTLTATFFSELNATLPTQAYYALRRGSSTAKATLVAARRFSERIGHAALFFKNRYWVIGGGKPQLPTSGTVQHTTLSDVWSSPDGKTWKLETDAAAWGPRWFHQAVVFNDAMWVIDGAPGVGPTATDVWSSTDGVNWVQRTSSTILPWHSTHLNVVTFNGAMWAVSGGTSFSSTDGVSWAARSTPGAIAGSNGRGYASLNVYNGSLWYIAGAPGLQAAPADAVNDVWKSSNGIDWVQVTPSAQFAPRIRHQAFVLNGRLWVFGGQMSDGAGGTRWALDAWSTNDGALWIEENTGGLDASYLAKVIEQTGPDRVTLIGGIQRGYSNNVWQTTNAIEWTTLSAQAQFSPRSARGVSFNGQMWIIGGATADRPDTGGDTNEVWRSNSGTAWTRVATTGTVFPPRDGHCVVVFQNKLWVIGGWENAVGAGGTDTRLNDVWSSSDGVAWTKHEPSDGNTIFAPRVAHDVAVFQDKLWVIGGNLQNGTDVNDVWSSPDGETWTLVQGNAAFSPRRSHRVVAFNNELWLIGGGTSVGTSEVWHSPDGVTWTSETASFAPRLRHALEVFNSRMYMLGGTSREEYEQGVLYNDVLSSADGINWTVETPAAGFAPRGVPALMVNGPELWLAGGFGLSFFNDVWRSSDGKNWRVGFSHDIVVP